MLDELGYRWFEEPISDYHIPLLRRLADELETPILAGEKTTPLGYLPEYVRQGAVDIVRGDVLMKAGITGMRKLAILAELHGYDLEIHGTLTPLLDIANLHVSCAIRNSEYAEVFWDPFYRFGLQGDPLVPDRDGLLHLPSGPGLGRRHRLGLARRPHDRGDLSRGPVAAACPSRCLEQRQVDRHVAAEIRERARPAQQRRKPFDPQPGAKQGNQQLVGGARHPDRVRAGRPDPRHELEGERREEGRVERRERSESPRPRDGSVARRRRRAPTRARKRRCPSSRRNA